MANVTSFTKTAYLQAETPTAPNPRLAAAVSSTATTITLTNGLLAQSGSKPTDNVIFGIKNRDNGYTELCYVTAANISSDGKTLSSVTRGISRDGESGVDLTAAVTANQSAHPQDSEVRVVVAPHIFEMMADALQGTLSSGGTSWQIGAGTDVNITVYAANGDANKPYFQYNAATNQWVYSNDGVSSTGFGTGAGVTGGDGISVTAGDIDIDLTDTTVFVQTSSGAGDSGKAARLNASGQFASGFIPAPTKSLTAGETFAQGELGYVETDGKAYKTKKAATSFSQLNSITTSASVARTARLSENKVVTIYSDTGIYAVVSTIAVTTPTSGSNTNLAATSTSMRVAVIDTDKFVVVYKLASSNNLTAVVCTVSGTTITVGTPVELYTAEALKTNAVDVCKLDTDKFLVTFVNNVTANPLAIACTVVGTVITAGSAVVIEAVSVATPFSILCGQMTTNAAIAFYNDGTNISTKLITVSGTTVTIASAATDLYAGTIDTEQSHSGVIVLDTQNVLFYNFISTTLGVRVSRLRITADTAFGVAPAYSTLSDTFLTSGDSNGKGQICNIGNNLIGYFYSDINADTRLRIYEMADNAFKEIYYSGVITTLSIDVPDLVAYSIGRNRLWMVCVDSSQIKYSIFVDSSQEFIGAASAAITAAASGSFISNGDATTSGLTAGTAYYVGNAGAVATSGTRRVGIATTTTNIYLS